MLEDGRKNPWAGLEQFLSMNGTTWTKSWVSRAAPGSAGIGVTSHPPGNPSSFGGNAGVRIAHPHAGVKLLNRQLGHGATSFPGAASTIARIASFNEPFSRGHASAILSSNRQSGESGSESRLPNPLTLSGKTVGSIPTAGAI